MTVAPGWLCLAVAPSPPPPPSSLSSPVVPRSRRPPPPPAHPPPRRCCCCHRRAPPRPRPRARARAFPSRGGSRRRRGDRRSASARGEEIARRRRRCRRRPCRDSSRPVPSQRLKPGPSLEAGRVGSIAADETWCVPVPVCLSFCWDADVSERELVCFRWRLFLAGLGGDYRVLLQLEFGGK
ncbi:hypothetical protein PVAP13_5NG442120 [Panicum virgatum]|uniref:Uncharacterized protein n=1 Tax=Panicum virgatum TaxID=38727 RepID=A0A8T0RZ39_PANVG|nr:hypothetical protein PVAP13_5NG442120 [Panicum virgatum]